MRADPKLIAIIIAIDLFAISTFGTLVAYGSTPLDRNRHIFINVANPDGVKYNLDGACYGGPDNTYYIKSDGGGVNELHLTTDPIGADRGQATETTSQSGVFYISNTGGRGFDNDIVLLVSVKGEVPDNFAIHLKSSGYTWTPAPRGVYTPAPPTDYMYVSPGIDMTFTKSDFIYGPNRWKPGPGMLGSWSLPLYFREDTSDPSNDSYLMFVDLDVGNLYPTKLSGATLVDGGAVKVEYNISNSTTSVAFNGYGWVSASNQDQGISFTNPTAGTNPSTASGYLVTYAGPVADFSSDTTGGPAPVTVHFTDASTGSPTAWSWAFGDGGTSAERNPAHTYNAGGNYTVSLNVTNAGDSNTVVKTGYILVGRQPAPVAKFIANQTAGMAPMTVQFNDTSINTPTAWSWAFGDGGTSTEQNPVHTYRSAGNYTVNLTASNGGGCSAPATILITVQQPAPVPGYSVSLPVGGSFTYGGSVGGALVASTPVPSPENNSSATPSSPPDQAPAGEPPATSAPTQAPPAKNNNTITYMITGLVIVLVLAGAGYALFFRKR